MNRSVRTHNQAITSTTRTMKNKLIAFPLLSLLGLLNAPVTAHAAAPSVTTLAATSITPTNATLNGTVNPNGGATTAYFQYGGTTNYGYVGAYTNLPPTNTTLTLPAFVASIPGAAGSNWTQTTNGTQQWSAIAASADGTRLAAVAHPSGPVNGGVWAPTHARADRSQGAAPHSP